MTRISLLLLIGMFGCGKDNATDLSKLRFPDPQRDFIKANLIDTTYTYIPQEDGRELIEYRTYDENGNVLVENGVHSIVLNRYDGNGLLVRKEAKQYGTSIDSISYELDPDSTILKQRWSNSKDEFKFHFDKMGRLEKAEKFVLTEHGLIKREVTLYSYNGKLLNKVYIFSPQNKTFLEYYLYYSPKGILDSATLNTSEGHRQFWNYDSLGLIQSNGHSRYVHIRRR